MTNKIKGKVKFLTPVPYMQLPKQKDTDLVAVSLEQLIRVQKDIDEKHIPINEVEEMLDVDESTLKDKWEVKVEDYSSLMEAVSMVVRHTKYLLREEIREELEQYKNKVKETS